MRSRPAKPVTLAPFRFRLALMGRRERAVWTSLSRPQDERLYEHDSLDL